MKNKISDVLFASAIPSKMDREETLPARFQRMLKKLPLHQSVKGKKVVVKMHLGGGIGYSTIHPLFVRLLVDHVKQGNPSDLFVSDAGVKDAYMRGYAEQTIGCRLASSIGDDGKDVTPKQTGWKHVPEVLIGNPILNADVLINFSHVKAHGDAGFGGACKNLGMGCVPSKTRGDMHRLEGKLKWQKAKCIRCNKCIEECSMKANKFNDKGDYEIFWHDCKMCMHCVLACPKKAIKIIGQKNDLMQEALARVAKIVIDNFDAKNVFHINVLTFITIFCDCWGLTTPAIVPDIGIFAGQDIAAVDCASLDAIKTKNLIPGSITPPFSLGKGSHLFEKIHQRDPYEQVRSLAKIGAGTAKYKIIEVK